MHSRSGTASAMASWAAAMFSPVTPGSLPRRENVVGNRRAAPAADDGSATAR
jgi:hypothetical protein